MNELDEEFANRPKPNPERWLILAAITFFGTGLAAALVALAFAAPTAEARTVWMVSAVVGFVLLLVWYMVMVSKLRDD